MQKKRKTRMYEPWGYRDENNYQSADIIKENDLDSFFAKVNYNRDDNKIHFSNRDGLEVGNLDVNEFIKSDQIVERAWYEDGNIYIKFTNGDLITIDVKKILDENEFKDGLQVIDGMVSVKKDPTSERWLTVSIDGVKVSGIQAEIDRLDERIDDEITRATSEEHRIEGRLNDEITRATNEENRINSKLDAEITRATQTEQSINHRVDVLNDELDAEESIREANDAALDLRITTETNDRISVVTAERNRAEAAENALGNRITNETNRATSAETFLDTKIEQEASRAIAAEEALDERIDEIISGSPLERLDELIEKLGYKDNDTLNLTNEHEVAFGEWNVSNTDVNPSGQTIFSIGVGTSAHDRKNAIEVRKDGTVYMWVEGDLMSVNQLLGQIAHEVYDNG